MVGHYSLGIIGVNSAPPSAPASPGLTLAQLSGVWLSHAILTDVIQEFNGGGGDGQSIGKPIGKPPFNYRPEYDLLLGRIQSQELQLKQLNKLNKPVLEKSLADHAKEGMILELEISRLKKLLTQYRQANNQDQAKLKLLFNDVQEALKFLYWLKRRRNNLAAILTSLYFYF